MNRETTCIGSTRIPYLEKHNTVVRHSQLSWIKPQSDLISPVFLFYLVIFSNTLLFIIALLGLELPIKTLHCTCACDIKTELEIFQPFSYQNAASVSDAACLSESGTEPPILLHSNTWQCTLLARLDHSMPLVSNPWQLPIGCYCAGHLWTVRRHGTCSSVQDSIWS